MDIDRCHQDQRLITDELELLEWVECQVPVALRLQAQRVVQHRRQQLRYEQQELLLLLSELEVAV